MHEYAIVLDVTNADGRQGARLVEVLADGEAEAASAGIAASLDKGDRIHDFSVFRTESVTVEPVLDLTHVPFPADDRGTTPFHGDGRF